MNAFVHVDSNSTGAANTLGELLYGGATGDLSTQGEWQQLVGAMANGNAQALRALHERSHRIIFTLLIRMVNDQRTAEELTVRTFQRAWLDSAQYVPESGSVLAWLMNLARDQALKAVCRPPTTGIEYRRALQAAVGRLTIEERHLFELVYFSSETIADAASRLGEPIESVTERLHVVLQKLCEAFASNVA